jgi:hypothetical protein
MMMMTALVEGLQNLHCMQRGGVTIGIWHVGYVCLQLFFNVNQFLARI